MTHTAQTMAPHKTAKRATKQRALKQRAAQLGLIGAAALVLGACQHGSSSMGTHDARFVNYDQRHALSLQQSEHTLPLLVGANAHALTSGDRTALSGFLQSYAAQGEGPLRIRLPEGSANAHAARQVLGDVHDIVAASGGNPGAVLVERYHVGNPGAHAPLVMAYDRVEAVTNPCGNWPDRMMPTLQHSDYSNFGCATQANFGVALADPRDLARPRGVGYPDAGRRAEVLTRYRRGQPTATEASDQAQASVAQVN